jgi:hypothetical protein
VGGADDSPLIIKEELMTQSISQRILHTNQPSSSRPRARWKVAAATIALAATATSATAAIVAVVAAFVQIAPPASVELNQLQSNAVLFAFNERQCFSLNFALQTDEGVIPAHTKMSSHFLHGDPFNQLLLDGRVRFDGPIIGVISTTAGLDATDLACGAPGTAYPTGTEINRGLEPTTQADAYQIIAGGFGIQARMEVPLFSFSDQIRVLTRCECDGDVCAPQ